MICGPGETPLPVSSSGVNRENAIVIRIFHDFKAAIDNQTIQFTTNTIG